MCYCLFLLKRDKLIGETITEKLMNMNEGGHDTDLHFIPNYIANGNMGFSLKVVSKNHGGGFVYFAFTSLEFC